VVDGAREFNSKRAGHDYILLEASAKNKT